MLNRCRIESNKQNTAIRKNHLWLKIVGLVIGGIIVLVVVTIGWSRIEYGAHPPIAHKRIAITLPFAPENEATGLIPMGETIAHPIPHGHPGLDFGWDHSVPLIAVADGTITNIARAEDMGEPVWYITLVSGQYKSTYKELDTYPANITEGAKVKRGDIIGYPHGSRTNGGPLHFQLHWEFAYRSFFSMIGGSVDRLCPLTYFDADARTRIENIWSTIPSDNKFKKDFPDICSGDFHNKDQ